MTQKDRRRVPVLTFHPRFGYRCSLCSWVKEIRGITTEAEAERLKRLTESEFREHIQGAHRSAT